MGLVRLKPLAIMLGATARGRLIVAADTTPRRSGCRWRGFTCMGYTRGGWPTEPQFGSIKAKKTDAIGNELRRLAWRSTTRVHGGGGLDRKVNNS